MKIKLMLFLIIGFGLHAMQPSQQAKPMEVDDAPNGGWGFDDVTLEEAPELPPAHEEESMHILFKPFAQMTATEKAELFKEQKRNLSHSSYEGQKRTIKGLVHDGVPLIDIINLTHVKALAEAVNNTDEDFVRFLLQHGARPTNDLLHNARTLSIASLLLDYGAQAPSIDQPYLDAHCNLIHLLHEIASSSNFDASLLSLYVNNGANVNITNKFGSNALMELIRNMDEKSNIEDLSTKARLLVLLGINTSIDDWRVLLMDRIKKNKKTILKANLLTLHMKINEAIAEREKAIHALLTGNSPFPSVLIPIIAAYLYQSST